MKNQIPFYLGLGILNPTSVITTNNETIAEYSLFGKTVARLILNDQTAVIEDYYEGKRLGLTSNTDLNRGISMHFNNWHPETDPRFKVLQDAVCSLGNIYFEYPTNIEKENQQVISFSPAGRLLIFRIPATLDHLKKIVDSAPNYVFEVKPFFRYNDAYHPALKVISKDNSVNYEPITIFELTVPLSYVYDAAKWLCDRDLILPEKKYRLIIQDIVCKQKESFQIFHGTDSDSWLLYTLHFKGSFQSKEDFEKKDDFLRKTALQ